MAQSIHNPRDFLFAGGVLAIALISFLFQVLVFTSDFRPDEWRAAEHFLTQLAGNIGTTEEIWVRVCLTLFNLILVGVLYSVGLIERHTLVVALIWPLTLFLFSKIYWEFFVFPLCLVRFDLTRREEVVFIAILTTTLFLTAEANLGVLLLWRCVLLAQKNGLNWSAPAGMVAIGLTLDLMMKSGAAASLPFIGQELARFSWTRDIVNPEFSIVETVAVFFASFHFFSLHSGAYWIDAIFSVLVLLLIFNRREAWTELHKHGHTVVALASVIFFFTIVTHAFQNARYYFFFLPVLAALTPPDRVLPLAGLGLLHVIFRGFSL